MSDFRLFATTHAGLERVLAEEISRVAGARRVEEQVRGVAFAGGLDVVYRANLRLRTAQRVLINLADIRAENREALYEGARAVAWEEHVGPDGTLAVDATGHGSGLGHTQFVSRVVKDAVVDRFRERLGRRPNVDVRDPDLRVNARLHGELCTLSIDTSGDRLHRRGYRPEAIAAASADAPLQETLAAGVLLLSGYRGDEPLIDPACGSGTFLVEAALIARNVAPGLLRKRFGFARHPSFDGRLWRRLVDEARSDQRMESPDIEGSDVSRGAVEAARAAIRAAGVGGAVRIRRVDLADLGPRSNGMIVTNLPYGERMGEVEGLKDLYRAFGDALKRRCRGATAHLLTGSRILAKHVGLRTYRRDILWNGPIECRLLHYRLY